MNPLRGDYSFLSFFEAIRIPEFHDGQRGAAAGGVDYFRDHTLDVAVTLGKIDRTDTGRTTTVLVVRFEDRR